MAVNYDKLWVILEELYLTVENIIGKDNLIEL